MARHRLVEIVKWLGLFFRRHGSALLLISLVILLALWILAWLFRATVWESNSPGRTPRNLGYVAFAALLLPYLHMLRRFLFNRRAILRVIPWGSLSCWLWWHMGAGCAAFLFTLLHSKAQANTSLTLAILVLLWTVTLSGIIGFFGTKLCYRLLALTVRREVGPKRLAAERAQLFERAEVVVRYSLLWEKHVNDWRGLGTTMLQEKSVLEAKLKLDKGSKTVIQDAMQSDSFPVQLQKDIIKKINEQLRKDDFCTVKDFKDLAAGRGSNSPNQANEPAAPQLPNGRTERLAQQVAHWAVNEPQLQRDIERRNRVYLEALCPGSIAEGVSPPEAVEPLFQESAQYLKAAFPRWSWLFSCQALEPVSHNRYLRVRELSTEEQRKAIDELWSLVQLRRQLDTEYWFHRLAGMWLLVHGPAAWALLILVLAHVISSVYYGGFF